MEDKSETTVIDIDKTRSLPLLTVDSKSGHSMIQMVNLRQSFHAEMQGFISEKMRISATRNTLPIEDMDTDSVMSFQQPSMDCIDKISTLATNPPTPAEYSGLAQYLSWSYFNATKQSVEDDKFQPSNPVDDQVRQLFRIIKNAGEQGVINKLFLRKKIGLTL